MAFIDGVLIPIIYMTFIILILLGLLYMIYRFLLIPIRVMLERGRVKRKHKKETIPDKHLLFVNEKIEAGWRYMDFRKYAKLFFPKKEVSLILYTYLKLNKRKGVKNNE